MSWKPLGKLVLVELHVTGSLLALEGKPQHNGLATVLAVGPDVDNVQVGDVVLLGQQSVLEHKSIVKDHGEHACLVPSPVLLAVREDVGDVTPVVSH